MSSNILLPVDLLIEWVCFSVQGCPGFRACLVGLGTGTRPHSASLQVTVEEDSYLAHPTRDRAKIQHSRRPPTRGHLMAVVRMMKKVNVFRGLVLYQSISDRTMSTRGACARDGMDTGLSVPPPPDPPRQNCGQHLLSAPLSSLGGGREINPQKSNR